jgi:hypothetical protein
MRDLMIQFRRDHGRNSTRDMPFLFVDVDFPLVFDSTLPESKLPYRGSIPQLLRQEQPFESSRLLIINAVTTAQAALQDIQAISRKPVEAHRTPSSLS